MTIGTLTFEVVGRLLQNKSCEALVASLDDVLLTVCESYDSDYKRFGYLGGRLLWVIPLTSFHRMDTVYKKIIKEVDRLFVNWIVVFDIIIREKGG
ncbi:MAG: hypothetical protein GH151_10555 [Bacteroidetes bacterium]|jgi:hypothetical protein|nr:hypothetical protein [Bacteroidota bacterium]